MKLLSRRLSKKYKKKKPEDKYPLFWSSYTPPVGFSHTIMCDAPAFGGCRGGTVQDESCLKCPEYIQGSNPRVEAFRK